MSSISDLKRKSQANFAFLQKEIEKSTTQGSSDERFWKPELDASGSGFAVIRFLPPSEGEEVPWAKLYNHAFQGPGGWFIENCPTTKGEKCPICAHNNGLWNSGLESDKEVARKQKRKLSYYSNIYVVKDPKHPENEGKVFLYRYGKKIFDKILAAMQPEFQDEEPVNVFDLWEGANFKLKIKTVAGYWNYDSSEFDRSAALSVDDEELQAIYDQQYPLAPFTAESEFKNFEELQTRLNATLSSAPVQREQYQEEEEPVAYEPAARETRRPSAPVEEDDALSYFARLAED